MRQSDGLELHPPQKLGNKRSEMAATTRTSTNIQCEDGLTVYTGLKEMVQHGATEVPCDYILPPDLQPGLSSRTARADKIASPVINLSAISDNEQRKHVLHSISDACRNWGYFQVVGHKFPVDLRKNMLALAREFFELPMSERIKYAVTGADSADPVLGRTRRTSSGYHSWRDLFKHRAAPVVEKDIEKWPSKPESYRYTVQKYTQEVKKITDTLLELIAESLNLSSHYFRNALGGEEMSYEIMSAYYPCCPQPDLALGIIGHTDPNPLTILIQDEVGLEVRKDGVWVPVTPVPNGFVVNLGDVFQIMTNGRYVSCEHRVVANAEQDRISVMLFLQPQVDVRIGVASELVTEDEPGRYTDITWSHYLTTYGVHRLDHKVTDLVKK